MGTYLSRCLGMLKTECHAACHFAPSTGQCSEHRFETLACKLPQLMFPSTFALRFFCSVGRVDGIVTLYIYEKLVLATRRGLTHVVIELGVGGLLVEQ